MNVKMFVLQFAVFLLLLLYNPLAEFQVNGLTS